MNPSPDQKRKKTVAITGPDEGGFPAWLFTAFQVRLAGGRPVRVRPGDPRGDLDYDALVVGGGADVSEDLYEENPSAQNKITSTNKRQGLMAVVLAWMILGVRRIFGAKSSRGVTDVRRDELELKMIDQAVKNKIPILGICRGMQLLNVYFKGSLNPNISGFYQEYPQIRTVFPKKKVLISPSTLLREIALRDEIHVNALHDQAIHRLGENLVITAKEKNGVIQAIEHRDRDLRVLGVQWHPEFLPQSKVQRRLFRWLTHE